MIASLAAITFIGTIVPVNSMKALAEELQTKTIQILATNRFAWKIFTL